jgi:hypothetical protein
LRSPLHEKALPLSKCSPVGSSPISRYKFYDPQCINKSTLGWSYHIKTVVFGSGDRSPGRINIGTIPSPHTIASAKLHIAKAEQQDDARNAKSFTGSMSSKSPIDAKQVSILNSNGPGSGAEHLMVCVPAKGNPSGKSRKNLSSLADLLP